jgi:hypothetical protein
LSSIKGDPWRHVTRSDWTDIGDIILKATNKDAATRVQEVPSVVDRGNESDWKQKLLVQQMCSRFR